MIPRRFFLLFDLLAIAVAFLAAYAFFPYLQALFTQGGALRTPVFESLSPPLESGDLQPIFNLAWVYLALAPVALVTLEFFGGYRPLMNQTRLRVLASSLAAPLAGFGFVALVLFALRSLEWSRLFIFSFTLMSWLALALYRLAARSFLLQTKKAGYIAKNVVLAGTTRALEWMSSYFDRFVPQTDYRLWGYLRIKPDQAPVSGQFGAGGAPLPLLGDVSDLEKLCVSRPIQEVIAIQSSNGSEWLKKVIEDCTYFQVPLRIVPEALLTQDQREMGLLYRHFPQNLPAVALAPHPWNSEALFVKRLVDICVSLVLLVLLSPFFALTALLIKLTTPNLPVFYRWRVVGKNGVEFTGYKFTSMWADAEQRQAELDDQNEMQGPVFKIKNDPRVTPLGRILRKFSINELPQLWSVLKGDMSLVGPRPAFRHELDQYDLWHKRKLSVQPGITCLWQVRGRNKISSFDDWARMDLEYIDNWSLWLDLRILVRTAWVVISGSGS